MANSERADSANAATDILSKTQFMIGCVNYCFVMVGAISSDVIPQAERHVIHTSKSVYVCECLCCIYVISDHVFLKTWPPCTANDCHAFLPLKCTS